LRSNPTTRLSELGILDQLIQQDSNKFTKELDSLILNIEKSYQEGDSSVDNPSSTSSAGEIDNSNEIKESVIAFPFFNLFPKGTIEWFESLIVIKKIAVCLIISKSVIFSALISIIFIFYGNILIEKYDLENRYPKLAKLIQLRQKFQKYYFKFYCGLILMAVLTEVIFSVAILLL